MEYIRKHGKRKCNCDNIYILYLYVPCVCRHITTVYVCVCVCRKFMMFANLVVTFVPIVVGLLFKFLGQIKNIWNVNESNGNYKKSVSSKKQKKTIRKHTMYNVLFALIKEHYRAMQIDKGVLWAYTQKMKFIVQFCLQLAHVSLLSSHWASERRMYICSNVATPRRNNKRRKKPQLDARQRSTISDAIIVTFCVHSHFEIRRSESKR